MAGLKALLDQTPREVMQRVFGTLSGRKPLRGFDADHVCLFVLSTGRAGTQTLAALLGLSRRVQALHEPTPLLFGLSKPSYECSDHPQARPILREAFRLSRGHRLKHALKCGRGYVETSPQATFLAPAIAEAVPGARFIHLVRNPQDVITSGMRRGWYAGHAHDETRIVPGPESEHYAVWDDLSAFHKNAWLWAETNRWIMDFCANAAPDATLRLRAEDIFRAEPTGLSSLFEFAAIPQPSARKIRSILRQKLNRQTSGRFARPDDWSTDMVADLRRLAGPTAKALNYEI